MDQIQSVFLTHGNVYKFDEDGTNNWVSMSQRFVPISILFDRIQKTYRIACAEPGSNVTLVNSPILPNTEFTLSSQKFGHWIHHETGVIYGIGFHTEKEQENFVYNLKKVQREFVTRLKNYKNQQSSRSTKSTGNPGDMGNTPRPTNETTAKMHSLNGQLTQAQITEKQASVSKIPVPIGAGQNFTDRNNNALQNSNTNPQVYTATIESSNNSHANDNNSKQLQDSIEASAKVPAANNYDEDTQRLLESVESYLVSAAGTKDNSDFNKSSQDAAISAREIMEAQRKALNIDNNQDSQSKQKKNGSNQMGRTSQNRINNNSRAPFAYELRPTFSTMVQQVKQFKDENEKLRHALAISAENVDRWETELNCLRGNNAQVIKALGEMKTKLEEVSQQNCEIKAEAARWRNHCQEAQKHHTEKFNEVIELQSRFRALAKEKSRLEEIVSHMKEEVRTLQEEASSTMFGEEERREMEEKYQKLLNDSRKELEIFAAQENDRKNVMRGVDHLMAGTIQGLINIHGQVKQSFSL